MKFAPFYDNRIEQEIAAVTRLAACGALNQLGILFPRVIEIRSLWGSGKGLMLPWKSGGTLWQYIRGDTTDADQLSAIIRCAAETMRSLHSLQPNGMDQQFGQMYRSAADLLRPDCIDETTRRTVIRAFSAVPEERIADEIGNSRCWIHGDCFSYQFLVDECGGKRVWLCDWETARIAQTGLEDLAQFWASMQLAVALNPELSAHAPRFWRSFQRGYGQNLSRSCLFRVLELQGLFRFSPRNLKFATVVPMRTDAGKPFRDDEFREHAVATYDSIVRTRSAQLMACCRDSTNSI